MLHASKNIKINKNKWNKTETEHIGPMDRPHRHQDPIQRYGSVPGCYLSLASLSVHPYAQHYRMRNGTLITPQSRFQAEIPKFLEPVRCRWSCTWKGVCPCNQPSPAESQPAPLSPASVCLKTKQTVKTANML